MSDADLYTDEFLNQDEVWYNRNGARPIKNMSVPHRRNAANFLLRSSKQLALVTLAWQDDEPKAREVWTRIGAPQEWIRQTPLFQRLIQGGADPDQYWAEQRD